jgi:hypothetical protein
MDFSFKGTKKIVILNYQNEDTEILVKCLFLE